MSNVSGEVLDKDFCWPRVNVVLGLVIPDSTLTLRCVYMTATKY